MNPYTYLMMIKRSRQTDGDQILWQKHLDSIQDEDSAEQFFIRQAKSSEPKSFLDPKNDFFVSPFSEENFPDHQNQLTLDVFETADSLIITAPIAGVDLDRLIINLDDDVLTIEGVRTNDLETQAQNYYYQECFWGKFSRSVILPSNISHDNVTATYRHGVLTIAIPKNSATDSISIPVQDLDE